MDETTACEDTKRVSGETPTSGCSCGCRDGRLCLCSRLNANKTAAFEALRKASVELAEANRARSDAGERYDPVIDARWRKADAAWDKAYATWLASRNEEHDETLA